MAKKYSVDSFYKIVCSSYIIRYHKKLPKITTKESCKAFCFDCCKAELYTIEHAHLAYKIDSEDIKMLDYNIVYARVCHSCNEFVIIDGTHKDKQKFIRCTCDVCDLSEWAHGKHSCGEIYSIYKAYIYQEFPYLLEHIGRINRENGDI